MKNNKSLKTVLLWLFLIVIFFAIYQTISRSGGGEPLTFSKFIDRALPTVDSLEEGGTVGVTQVTVYEKEGVIRYRESSVDEDSESGSDLLGTEKTVRGDINTVVGSNGQTLLGLLAKKGVTVDIKGPDQKSGIGNSSSSTNPFSDLVAAVQAARTKTCVSKVMVRGKQIQGEFKGCKTKGFETHKGQKFTTVGELGEYRKALIERGVEVEEEPEGENSLWLSILGTWLPMIFIFLIFFLFMRQLQSGGGKAMSFGKSRHRLLNEANNRITFKDIAGIEEAKEELQEIIHFLKDPKKFTRLGGRIPKGVLLMGPPGTGKTLLARGVAGEAGVPFFSISGSDFVEMFVGVGASRVRDLSETGKKNAPCIIFIDEIDAVGRHRGAGVGGGHDEREQTLNQLLVEMDGFESNEGVILVAATNRPDVLDPALLRPGRFDRRVMVSRPDVKGRHEILKVHTRKARLADSVRLEVIARGTPGFSGADLENLVNESALLAARRDKDAIEMIDLEDAKDKVMMGAERKSAVLTKEEKKVTAYHEAGHALVAAKVAGNDPVHKVTIIPRGMALGLTWTLPENDHHTYSMEQVLGKITMAMGGRVAEEIIFNKVTTGAGNDIEQATKLARKMVCEWGMSKLGPISLARNNGNVFLGMEMTRANEFSESTQAEADSEIRRILDESYALALKTVKEGREELDLLADSLLEFESIDSEDMAFLLSGKSYDEYREWRLERDRIALEATKRGPAKEDPDEEPEPEGGGGEFVTDISGLASTRDSLDES